MNIFSAENYSTKISKVKLMPQNAVKGKIVIWTNLIVLISHHRAAQRLPQCLKKCTAKEEIENFSWKSETYAQICSEKENCNMNKSDCINISSPCCPPAPPMPKKMHRKRKIGNWKVSAETVFHLDICQLRYPKWNLCLKMQWKGKL